MNVKAPGHFHLQKRLEISRGGGQLDPKHAKHDGRSNALVIDLEHEAFECIEAPDGNTEDVPRLVIDGEHKDAIMDVGNGCDLVGKIVSPRVGHPIAPKRDGLELQGRIFAQSHLVQEFLGAVKHEGPLVQCGGSAPRRHRVRLP